MSENNNANINVNTILGGKTTDEADGNTTSNNTTSGSSSISAIEKKVSEIFNQTSECHFVNGDQSHQAVCSPKPIIEKMKEFAAAKGRHDVAKAAHPQHIVNGMKDLLNCNSESCVLKRKDFVEFAKITNIEDILNNFFKPEGPAVGFGLLSNFNIDDVLDQFEKRFAHRSFLHIPFQMRDFEKVGTQLATVDLAHHFKSGKKTFGVALNTDWSSGKGIHWFCLFGEHHGDKIMLEYFNSSGKEPLPEVQAWIQKTKHYLTKELKIPVQIHYFTGIEFQSDDHSCGLYVLAYIWMRLEQVPPTWFKAENFNDDMMHRVRKNMFRWEL